MLYKLLYLILVILALSACGTLRTEPTPVATPVPVPQQAERSEALLQAILALGIDYRNGGRSPVTGFDCSGLVAHVFQEAWGVRLPRDTKGQSETGVPVSLAELEPGDLVFYNTQHRPYSHVGIYLGDGRFVHAPKTGSRVRVESLAGRYWSKRFDGARRIALSGGS